MSWIAIARKIDKYVGYIIIFFLLPFNFLKRKYSLTGKKILIIRFWALGDSLLLLPTVKQLKEKGYSVSVLVTKRNKQVFESVDFVDEIIDLTDFHTLVHRINYYDVVIDSEHYFNLSAIMSWILGKSSIGFKGSFRERLYKVKVKYNNKIHIVYTFCNLLSPLSIKCKPKKLLPLKYTQEDKERVDNLLKRFNLTNKKLIGIHCGTAETAPWRSWKKEKFAKLIEELVKERFYIILTGSKREYEVNKKVLNLIDKKFKDKVFNFAGKTNLRELAYLLTKFKVFVSNDTGPMHLSAAMGTKTIGLFGPNVPERYAPFGKGNIAIYKARNLECSPCINVHKGEFKKCKLNGKCMDLIEVEDVYNAVMSTVKK